MEPGSHPLDASTNPLVRTVPQFARQFRHDAQQAAAAWLAAQHWFEAGKVRWTSDWLWMAAFWVFIQSRALTMAFTVRVPGQLLWLHLNSKTRMLSSSTQTQCNSCWKLKMLRDNQSRCGTCKMPKHACWFTSGSRDQLEMPPAIAQQTLSLVSRYMMLSMMIFTAHICFYSIHICRHVGYLFCRL